MLLNNVCNTRRHLLPLNLHLLVLLIVELNEFSFCPQILVAPPPEVYTSVTVFMLASITSLTSIWRNWVPVS